MGVVYHAGSLAFGSFVLSLLHVILLFTKVLAAAARDSKDKDTAKLAECLSCCVECFKSCFK